jgi:molecular chaperone Hsp33
MSEHRAGQTISDFDKLLNFTLPDRNARGRIVRLGPVLGKILAAHDYPPTIKQLLAEALVLTALMGGLLKKEGSQLTMQAQTEAGVVELLVCDYRDGELRGYVKHDAGRIAALAEDPTLAAMFGKGSLAITFDVPSGRQRYQGMVPLEGNSLTEAVERYFARSEQVPTVIRTAVRTGVEGCIAGGVLVQHLAEGEEGRERLHNQASHLEWDHIAILVQSVRDDELVDPELSSEELLWRLFHEEREIRVQPAAELSRGCRCSVLHFEEVLARFPKEDRREMRDENGIIRVDCAFCSKEFPIQD